jgi:hypothetical protein
MLNQRVRRSRPAWIALCCIACTACGGSKTSTTQTGVSTHSYAHNAGSAFSTRLQQLCRRPNPWGQVSYDGWMRTHSLSTSQRRYQVEATALREEHSRLLVPYTELVPPDALRHTYASWLAEVRLLGVVSPATLRARHVLYRLSHGGELPADSVLATSERRVRAWSAMQLKILTALKTHSRTLGAPRCGAS